MTVLLTTGDENANQQLDVYVQGRSSPMRISTQSGVPTGLVPPLSTTLFADAGTAVAPGQQDGSIANPFSSLAALIAATGGSNGFSAMLTPGDYGSAAVLGAQSLALVGMGLGGNDAIPLIGQITCNGSSLRVSNANVFVDATDSDLHFTNCTAGVVFHAPGGSVEFIGSIASGVVSGATNVVARDGGSLNTTVTADDVQVFNAGIGADITCTNTLLIRQLTTFAGGITLTADIIDIDAESLRLVVQSGATLNANSFQGFTGDVFTFGAAAMTTAEFLPLGTRENLVTTNNESAVNFYCPARKVACFMRGYSSGDATFRFRIGGVDSLLTLNVNNSEGNNNNTFVDVPANSVISVGVTVAVGTPVGIMSLLLV